MTERPRRVSVVGCPGSGKTTFAVALAARIGAAHVEIDALNHGPDWTPAPRDVLRARIAARLAGESWVVDGNYRNAVGDLVRGAADTVVWLDLPRSVTMRSVVARTWGRVTRGTVLWNGNRERWWKILDPRPSENIVLWAWLQYGEYVRRYEAEMADGAPHVWHRFRTREDAWRWLETI